MARLSDDSTSKIEQARKFSDFVKDALAAEDLEDLLYAAIRNMAEGLDTEHAKILRPQDDGRLLVVAGIGWQEGVIGHATLPGAVNSPAGYAMQTGLPVRSNNLAEEDRFRTPQLLQDHGIKSAINVIIYDSDGPFGVLEIDATSAREFTSDDTAFMESYAQLLSSAIKRIQQTEKLKAVSTENKFLLEELHHRIGNDFQLVMSLINFRQRQSDNDAAKSELTWVLTRLRSLADLHSHLRKTNSLSRVQVDEYLKILAENLASVHQFPTRGIALKLEMEPWALDARGAVSVGLILNEFVTNSVEHAFATSGGQVTVSLKIDGTEALFVLSDDGPGFDQNARTNRSGLSLMQSLAQSVASDISRTSDNGVKLSMRLKSRGDAE